MLIGCDAIGSEVLYTLIQMGANHVYLIEFDHVAVSNLHRQLLYFDDQVGKLKAVSAAQTISRLFDDQLYVVVKVHHNEKNDSVYDQMITNGSKIQDEGGKRVIHFDIGLKKFDDKTASNDYNEWLINSDYLVSAVDNPEARRLLYRMSLVHGKPMLDGGADGLSGSTQMIFPLQSSFQRGLDDPVLALVKCTPPGPGHCKRPEDTVHYALNDLSEFFFTRVDCHRQYVTCDMWSYG